ncbi:MAG: hypothetical protein G8345_09970 [Magnetococcales bacterium]|nr:hypothetical protein [Magnetococcales bacterium]NGZ27197.1 hypothetical protein [Magnetococcales bacterium]
MPVQSDDFLEFARWIYLERHDEIAFRNVISRAYYAAYLTFRPYVDPLPKIDIPAGEHEKLFRRVEVVQAVDPINDAEYLKELKNIVTILRIMRKKRAVADYEMGRTINKFDSQNALHQAEKIISLLSQLGKPRPVASST